MAFSVEVEAAVPREQLQHVIEEADAGAVVERAVAIDVQGAADLRLGRAPVDHRAAHTSSSAATAFSVCSTTPAVTRMQPGTTDPRSVAHEHATRNQPATIAFVRSPPSMSTKLAALFQ